jgi:hypothetical protein
MMRYVIRLRQSTALSLVCCAVPARAALHGGFEQYTPDVIMHTFIA